MSRAAKRRAKRLSREREVVARFIADVLWCEACSGSGQGEPGTECPVCLGRWGPDMVGVLGGDEFDVAIVRTAAESLIGLADEQTVFEDWCRERGQSPETSGSPAATRRGGEVTHLCDCADWDDELVDWQGDQLPHQTACKRTRHHGGWPGRIAREYAWRKCSDCDGRGVRFLADCEVSERYAENLGCRDGWHVLDCIADTKGPCESCEGRGRVRIGDRDSCAPMGRRLAAIGRAVLSAVEGQSSECQAVNCDRGTCLAGGPDRPPDSDHVHVVEGPTRTADGRWTWRYRCLVCEGTGHNLGGSLPPVTLDRDTRAALLKAFVDGGECPRWAEGVGITQEEVYVYADALRRAHPRGQHRDPGVYAHPSFLLTLAPGDRPTLDERITSRTMHHEHLDMDRLPRWRRGEIRHAARQAIQRLVCRRCRDLGVADGEYCPDCVRPLAMRTPWTQDFAHEVVVSRAAMAPHLSLDRFADAVATFGLAELRASVIGESVRLDQIGVRLNGD